MSIYAALSAARSRIKVLKQSGNGFRTNHLRRSSVLKLLIQYCEMNDVPVSLIQVDTLQKAKELPCVFNNWGVFYKGKFETVNLIDAAYLKRILKK